MVCDWSENENKTVKKGDSQWEARIPKKVLLYYYIFTIYYYYYINYFRDGI